MDSSLLATKLHRPAINPRRVPRPQLIQRLNEGLEQGHTLTLVSAPAGFGKSTLVAEWIEGLREVETAWLALDAADNDPQRFLTYFLAALRQQRPGLAADLTAVLQTGQAPPLDVAAAALLNELAANPRRMALVLDDFHSIQENAILEFFEALLAHPLPTLHLVLSTREDPLLPLGRLRANDQMTEIRAGDLRFSPAETQRFLNDLLGLGLSAADAAALDARTEGWAVGLQLAGLSMRGRPDPAGFIATLSGSHRYFLSYLTEEVLNRQPAPLQDFLLKTSLLDEFCAPLCDALLAAPAGSSAAILRELERSNLFLVSLDDDDYWYRYHHLFADLLRSQSDRLPQAEILALHRRASRWYEQANQAPQAIEHALAGEDYPSAVRLLEQHALPVLLQGNARRMEGWLKLIPPEWRTHSIRAQMIYAWTHLMRGSYAEIPPDLLPPGPPSAPTASDALPSDGLRAEWAALQANLLYMQGRTQEAVEQGTLALELTDPQDHYLLSLAYLGLGGAYRQAGRYHSAVEAYQRAIQDSRACDNLVAEVFAVGSLSLEAIQHGELTFAEQVCLQSLRRLEELGRGNPPITGPMYAALGWAELECNRIDAAREDYLKGERKSAISGHTASLIGIKIGLSRVHLAAGDLPAADRAYHEALGLAAHGGPAWLRPEIIEQGVRLALRQDNLSAAEAILGQAGLDTPQQAAQTGGWPGLAWLELLIARRDLAAALDLATALWNRSTSAGLVTLAIRVALRRAVILSDLGRADESQDDLLRALDLAGPAGCLRPFMEPELQPDLPDLLARLPSWAVSAGSSPAGAARADLLAQLRRGASQPVAPPPAGGLVEALTPREIETLRLMAEGLKYEEIAARLFVSLNTVRFYVKGAYGKLGVNNRVKAIAAARQHGLL